MSATQFFPVPPEIFARASATVSSRVSQLPFLRGGVTVSGELVGVAMESLNAVPSKALALATPQGPDAAGEEGLDRCLEGRLHIPGKTAAPVIAEVLCSAGIAEPALIPDRHAHRERRGIRLVPPWTWHIASTLAPSVRPGAEPGMSWMDLCPICRTGILSRVTGKQLFGIPRTDYYIECGSCGSKFIPVGPAFRLVSIAAIRDPLWKRYLDRTHTPDEWASLARGSRPAGPGVPATARPAASSPATPAPRAPGIPLPVTGGTLAVTGNGSLAVAVGEKTLYFRPLPLTFAGGTREGTYARVGRTLGDLIADPAYTHLRDQVNLKYSRYLPLNAGLFLSQLKERHDTFSIAFLNPYGDAKFGNFRVAETDAGEKAGILLVVVNRGIYRAVDCPVSIRSMVNDRFGRVRPEDCLFSGDPLRCRINSLLCTSRKEAGLFFYPEETEEERRRILDALGGGDPAE